MDTRPLRSASKYRPVAAGDRDNAVMSDDEQDAWQLHHHGSSWEEIGADMGCSPAAARSLAAAYERRTDTAAQAEQNALF